MDSIFQSLVLDQNSTSAGNANAANSGDKKSSRGSRYAQLIPREALRQPPPSSLGEGDVNVAFGSGSGGVNVNANDAAGNINNNNNGNGNGNAREEEEEEEEEETIRVYKMDDATGRLELLPEDNYDVVYYDNVDNDDDGNVDERDNGDGAPADLEKKKEQLQQQQQQQQHQTLTSNGNGEKVVDGEKSDAKKEEEEDDDANAMDVDENDEIPKSDETQTSEHDRDTTIYIVKTPAHTPRNSNNNNNNLISSSNEESNDIRGNDTASSSSSDSEEDLLLSNSIPLPPNHSSRESSHSASTLTRALVSRTDGYDESLQNNPRYEGLIMSESDKKKKTEEQLLKKKKKKERERKEREKRDGKKKGKSSPGGKGSGGKEDDDANAKSPGENKDKSDDEEEPAETTKQRLFQTSKELVSNLPPSANVVDGDSPKTLQRLQKLIVRQERFIVDPRMAGVELEDWEDGIDWDGCCGGSGSENEREKNEQNETTTMKMEGKDAKDKMEVDAPFKPPAPIGGHPKRPRRAIPQYDDPVELLLEPRNPRLEALDLSTAVDWDGAPSDNDSKCDDDEEEEAPNVPLILQSSIAGRSVAALHAPSSSIFARPPPFENHPNYQSRYKREMNADEIPAELANHSVMGGAGGSEALEKYKKARQKKREQMAKDKQSRVTEVMGALSLTGTGRRITSSLMGPGGAERTGRPSRHALGSSSVHDAEYVEQLELVYNHTLVKPDLTLSEYRQFHRPRLPLIAAGPSCPWQFQTRVIIEHKRGKRAAGATAADGSTVVGSYNSMMSAGGNKGQNKIKNEADLSPTIGDLVVIEYSEERLPLFMTKGTTCRIVNYYRGDRARCPISAGGGDRPMRKRHGDKAAAADNQGPSAIGIGGGGSSMRAERPPRLRGPNQYSIKSAADLMGIIGLTAKKKKSKEALALEAKKAKENVIDVLPEGVTEVLHQKVHGPFIGEVEEGKTQTGLVSNLFAAPMFRHESEPTDFLMILGLLERSKTSSISSSGKETYAKELGVVLRPLPADVYCVGQTEPRVKVFAPNTNDEKKFVNAFVPYQVAKNIERKELRENCGLTFDDIKDRLFANTSIPHGQLRQRIKQVANFERANNGIWSLKALGEDDFPGVEALGRKVSPEGVAAYESQCAGIRRLRDLGVEELYSGGNTVSNVAAVMIYLNGAVQSAMERRLKVKKALEVWKKNNKKKSSSSQENTARLNYFEKAYEKLDGQYREVKKRQEVAKFIYEELQLSPWNISGEFIDVHKRAVGGAMMKLTGIGDPSGVGEAYNFLREADSRSSKAQTTTSASDGALKDQIAKITGTQNDLRKLTMKQMASLLRSYGMKDKQISVLKRWDRVHVIRDLSTKAASDGMGDEMGERFARGEKLRLSDQRQNYKQRIQEIWRRQIAALNASDAPGNDVAASRSDAASAKETSDTAEKESTDASKEKDDGSDGESDSSGEDDDFLADMEMEMNNTGEANRLMRDNFDGMDTQGLSKDAREFAALRNQREEERAMLQGGLQKGGLEKPKKKFKVIRRKVTKTRTDGTQTVTFEFIINRAKVDDIISKKKMKEGDKKFNSLKKKKKIVASHDNHDDDPSSACVGHAMFEDEDNIKRGRGARSLKVKIKKETRVLHKKFTGPRKASHSKLTSGIKHSRTQKQDERKKKRMKKKEEEELYKSHVKGRGTSNRKERGSARERMPHVILSDRLEAVRTAVEGRPQVGAFLKPVNKVEYPHYYEVINEPIDLNTIREKNRKYDYKTAKSFLAEFELMKANAIKFNGRGTALANEAVEICDFVKTEFEQNHAEFARMEDAVRNQMSGKKKKKSKAKTAAPSSFGDTAAGSSGPMNTAKVVGPDGIETQVNLGANLSFGFGDDSDSDDS